jgi:tetratricopeptide (TPR) repeat protein
MSMLCSQCGEAAQRCETCGAGVCARRFCAELHEVACAAVSALPKPPGPGASSVSVAYARPTVRRRERNPEAERALAEQLMLTISHHRQAGRAALLAGDLDTAFDELWAARQLEPDLDRLGAEARAQLPADWEIETDLTPLARALAARQHPRAIDAWRGLLEDKPARSVQAEAAEWLAEDAVRRGQRRAGLRALHAASQMGRGTSPETFHRLYREAGLDPAAMFQLYLVAAHLDTGSARAMLLRDPLTNTTWSDQDARWWLREAPLLTRRLEGSDHQAEALGRARDLALGKRDAGWLLLAEGDFATESIGVRALGRAIRAGCTDPADEDTFVRIRLCYEGAAEKLPDVAWPWYRLAELLAWAGYRQRAVEYLAEAERRRLGPSDRANRPVLHSLVAAGLDHGMNGVPTQVRPFPAQLFGPSLFSRLRRR